MNSQEYSAAQARLLTLSAEMLKVDLAGMNRSIRNTQQKLPGVEAVLLQALLNLVESALKFQICTAAVIDDMSQEIHGHPLEQKAKP